MIDYRLYLVTDDPSRYAGNWLDNVVASVEGGVTCVQYRDTESAPDGRYARARALQDALRPRRVPLVVNNDVELAAALRAEGVHVGQSDLPPRAVRVRVGARCAIGYSLTCAELFAAKADDIRASDCLGLGPVFDARRTKADAADALGLDGLAELVRLAGERPTVAIGGLSPANAAAVLATGVTGLALVSAFSRTDDPFRAAQTLRRLFPNP